MQATGQVASMTRGVALSVAAGAVVWAGSGAVAVFSVAQPETAKINAASNSSFFIVVLPRIERTPGRRMRRPGRAWYAESGALGSYQASFSFAYTSWPLPKRGASGSRLVYWARRSVALRTPADSEPVWANRHSTLASACPKLSR